MMNMAMNKYSSLASIMLNERRPREQILSLQLQKLRKLVRHTYANVPFYRELYKTAGIKTDDIQKITDLQFLPIVAKHDFHACELSDLMDKRIGNTSSLKSIKTSGSSGKSLEFFVGHTYNQLRKAQYLRPYITNGRRLTDHVMRFSSRSGIKEHWMQKFGIMRETFVYANSDASEHVKIIRKLHPNIIQGYGSELSLLAQEIIDQGHNIPKQKVIFTDSELLTSWSRSLIKTAFSTDVIDVYGTYETGNIGYECSEHNGYHLTEDSVIVEFLDKDMRPVQPGEQGELVFTVLDNYTMPFIRYRIGDVGSYIQESCSCGRTFFLMTKIIGRTTDYAICANGTRKSPTALIGVFKELANSVREYQVIQKEINLFEVLVVPKNELCSSIVQTFTSKLINEFPESTVKVKSVKSIKRNASGKFKPFVQCCN